MRKLVSILFVLLLASSLMGQGGQGYSTGNISGKVVDSEGNSLPGVTVTITGQLTAPMTSISSSRGRFRFISLASARDYALKAELQGFKTIIRHNIIVVVGANVELTLVMEMGTISEEVLVVASTPLVDTKRTTIGMNFTEEIIQSIPTARDPWVILQFAPSVLIDRENVGGVESGHQSLFVAHGAAGRNNNQFTMDGIDTGSSGASNIYYDVDAFEEINITIGGSDVRTKFGGVSINMVMKRGGNKIALGGRYYLTDQHFQAANITDELLAEGVAGTNRIRVNRDYGVNIGFPLLKDKIWFWGSWGEQMLQTTTIYGSPDDTQLSNMTAKLNVQLIPQNRLEFMASGHKKYKYGGGQSSSNPDGIIQLGGRRFGVPLLKVQDEHMFGSDLYTYAKYNWSGGYGGHVSVLDPDVNKLAIYDVTDQRYYDSFSIWRGWDSNHFWSFLTTYYNDNIMGARHELMAGIDYEGHTSAPQERGSFTGNILVRRNYNTPTVDSDGDGLPDIPGSDFYRFEMNRPGNSSVGQTKWAAFISDTVSFGNFNLILGLRYDIQTPFINDYSISTVDPDNLAWAANVNSATATLLKGVLPDIDVAAIDPTSVDGSRYNWTSWSPRIGFTWDINGNGKTVAKLAYASYGSYQSTGEANTWKPGGAGGWMEFWWQDDGDGMVDSSELYWHTIANYAPYRVFNDAGGFIGDYDDAGGVFYGGYDPANPTSTTAPFRRVDANAGGLRTREIVASLEREIIPDFAVSVNATFRRYDQHRWNLKYFPETDTLQDQSWYISAGTAPATIPGVGSTKDAANNEYYYTSVLGTTYSPYSYRQRRPDFHQDYYGIDLILNKRLSNKWMMNGSFTWGHQEAKYGDAGFTDPTNLWAYEGEAYSPNFGGGSGKINQYIFTRWIFKLAGLYQLPMGVNIAATVLAREGYIQKETVRITNYTLPNPQSRTATLDMTPFGSQRLPKTMLVTLRLEKMFKLGDVGRVSCT